MKGIIILLGAAFMIPGFLNLLKPEAMLRWQRDYTIRGRREYSSSTIFVTRIMGLVMICIGCFIICYSLKLNI